MDEYGDNIISISDEDGNDYDLCILDETYYQGVRYLALVEAKDISEEENTEIIILKEIKDEITGEDMLSTMDSDEEEAAVLQQFEDQMFADDDEAFADDEE